MDIENRGGGWEEMLGEGMTGREDREEGKYRDDTPPPYMSLFLFSIQCPNLHLARSLPFPISIATQGNPIRVSMLRAWMDNRGKRFFWHE